MAGRENSLVTQSAPVRCGGRQIPRPTIVLITVVESHQRSVIRCFTRGPHDTVDGLHAVQPLRCIRFASLPAARTPPYSNTPTQWKAQYIAMRSGRLLSLRLCLSFDSGSGPLERMGCFHGRFRSR